MATSPTSPAAFTGTSTYSTQLQTVLTRAIAIDSLGLDTLQANTTTIQNQTTAVQALDTAFTGLQTAVSAIQTATGVASLSAAVSTAGVVQPTLSTGALPGTYSIEVTQLGSATSTLSDDGLTTVSDPTSQNIDPATSFTLAINGVDTTITPAAANLNSLVSAINAQSASLNVQASIVNVGSSAAPDYRLAVQSTALGQTTIQLTGTTTLLNQLSLGQLSQYKVNGESTVVSSDSNTITLSPGLSVNLLQQSPVGVATTITVTSSTSSVSSAFAGLATAYNAAVTAVSQNTGTNTSAITGNSILTDLQQSLNDLAFYSGTGSLSTLTSLGFSFDQTGVLSFDPTAFATATANDSSDLNTFLGDANSGFIQSATATLSSIEDPTTGYLKTEEAELTTENTNNNTAIATAQAQVAAFTTSETAQISAADALISQLQATNTFVTGLFAAETDLNTASAG